MKQFAVIALLLLVSNRLSALERPGQTVLVIESGGHTGTVRSVHFTPDGRELISTGNDQTIRVWDTRSGELNRVLRLPIYHTAGGNTSALSPDGRTLAVYCRGAKEDDHWIYLVELASARIPLILKNHTGEVNSLAFSHDGKRLASGSRDATARVWSAATGESEQILRGHGTYRVYGVAFSPDDSKLVTASGDETAKVWSLKTGKVEAVLQDKEMRNYATVAVAWSPDGQTIATGHFNPFRRLWKTDGTLIRRDRGGGQVQFSSDSKSLLAWLRMADVQSGKELARCEQFLADVYGVALSADDKLAAGAGENGQIYLWNTADGTMIHKLVGKTQGPYGIAWSQVGSRIAWGVQDEGQRHFLQKQFNQPQPIEHAFHLVDLEFAAVPDQTTPRLQSKLGKATVEVNRGTGVATIMSDGEALKNAPGQFTTCYTFLANGNVVVYTTAGIHVLSAATGDLIRSYPLDGTHPVGREVCASHDNRYLLSSHSDQTLRIWTLDRDKPLLSLFFAGNDWIAWTPEGYYAASAGGEKLIGWQINNGPDKMASFYPAAQFRTTFYRPDVIKRLLDAGGLEKALELADKASGKKTQITEVAEVLPPIVFITSPDKSKIDVTEPTVEVRFIAKPVGKHPITGVRLMLDGRPYPGAEYFKKYDPPRTGEVRDSWTIKLDPGKHTVAVQVESAVSKALSEPVEITLVKARGAELEPGDQEKNLELPSLYVLAIGVSEYPQEKMKLKFAAKDAQVLAKTFQSASHNLYRNIEVKVLTDKDATRRNIMQGLTWLRKQMTQRDVAIVSFAGHGSQDSDGKLYLLPVDVDKEDLLSTAVPGEQIKSVLGSIPGRVIVLLDACHSGAVDGEKRRGGGSLTDDLVRDLVTDDYGVVVMCSSMGREFSLESDTVAHGFFTLALVEGLSGKADYDKTGVVYLNGLDLYVTTRVKDLSTGKQHPVTTRPTSIRSFPLSRPEPSKEPGKGNGSLALKGGSQFGNAEIVTGPPLRGSPNSAIQQRRFHAPIWYFALGL
jgi:WD40 repeat protein